MRQSKLWLCCLGTALGVGWVACAEDVSVSPIEGGQWRSAQTPWRQLSTESRGDYLQKMVGHLDPLHPPMPKPGRGDWLSSHKELGQSFADYLRAGPVTARAKRRVIYIARIGVFSEAQKRVVTKAVEGLGLYFDLDVRFAPDVLVGDDWPTHAQRRQSRGRQLLTTHILDRVLLASLPEDAAVMLGLAADDLWPGDGWNFVYGQAYLRHRVGVWSIDRNGNPAESDEAFRLCLLRTLKTATHETGHMFTMAHCTAHACNMAGSNNRDESDRWPLGLCSQCAPKLSWATGAPPIERYKALAAFCRENRLDKQAGFYQKCVEALPAYRPLDPAKR